MGAWVPPARVIIGTCVCASVTKMAVLDKEGGRPGER